MTLDTMFIDILQRKDFLFAIFDTKPFQYKPIIQYSYIK